MRYLGDKYVASEFQQHKASDDTFVAQFMNTWRIYAEKLEEQTSSNGKLGLNLGDRTLDGMSRDQREKMEGLGTEITGIAPPAREGEGGGGGGGSPLEFSRSTDA